jgi:hypothetical protein
VSGVSVLGRLEHARDLFEARGAPIKRGRLALVISQLWENSHHIQCSGEPFNTGQSSCWALVSRGDSSKRRVVYIQLLSGLEELQLRLLLSLVFNIG